jgi:cation:H+ antiporter
LVWELLLNGWFSLELPNELLPLWTQIIIFLIATGFIGMGGTRMASLADRLADRTGLGEAITGSVFLGLITALPGLAVSVSAALDGFAAMAISSALGGIAVQTAALGVADLCYRKANLEHAAASAPNMMQASVLVALLTTVLLALAGPDTSVGHIHPFSILLFFFAGFGFFLVTRTKKRPMWQPRQTDETVSDTPKPGARRENLPQILLLFLFWATVTMISGVTVAESAGNVVVLTGISESLMGGLFLALASSLPELFTSIAAVKRGALTLAVSDVVGGNFFDILFVSAADVVYLQGSIFHARTVGERELFLAGLTILLNVVLLSGLLYRQKRGPGNIGFESVLMLLLYLVGFTILSFASW